MNKKEYLEILRDYLNKDFSKEEVSDILRDYEEYFVDGIIEGKSDIEIISHLGSPKAIAEEFVSQIKGEDEPSERKIEGDSIVNKKVLNKKINKAVKGTQKASRKFSSSLIDFFNGVPEKITDLLTINIEKDTAKHSGVFARIVVLLAIFILTCFLLIPLGMVLTFIAMIASCIVIFAFCAVVLIPFAFKIATFIPSTGFVLIFMYIMFIGAEILGYQLTVFVSKHTYKLVKLYINWIKTRTIYVRASKRKYGKSKLNLEKGVDDIE